MRQFFALPFVVATGFASAGAFALDCAALKDTDTPFAVTLEVKTHRAGGEAPTTRAQQVQVFRKGAEVTTYTVDSPGIYLRTRGPDPFFPLQSFYSSQADDPRTWTYSVAPTTIYPAGKPLRYSADMKGADGKVRLAATMSLEYVEAGTRQIGGCVFVVAKIRRTLEGLADGQPVSNSSEVWFAPALRTVIASTLRTGNVEVTSTPTAISLEFKRVE